MDLTDTDRLIGTCETLVPKNSVNEHLHGNELKGTNFYSAY